MAHALPIRDENKVKTISRLLNDSPRDSAIFLVGINTALRGSDLLNLTAGQVRDLPSGSTVKIREQKTGKFRDVYFNNNATNAIRRLLESQHFHDDDYLFQSQRGRHLTRDSLSRMVRNWCNSVGLHRSKAGTYGAHTLRKTLGYHMYRNGARIADLMHIFNHSSPGQTLTYICIESREVKELHDGMNLG